MDGARLSLFPQLSWLSATFSLRADNGPTGIHLRSVAHSISMPLTGRHSVRWIRQGHERTWVEHPGTVHFRPCSWDWQDFVIDSHEPGDVLAFFIPPSHMEELLASEDVEGDIEHKRCLLPHDSLLQRSMLAISECQASSDQGIGRADEAARRLVLRLAELCGCRKPDWHDDASVFDRRVLARLVEYLDAHLKIPPSLYDLSLHVGLSPSHFAKKFRQTTGLSLHRFVNRRRIVAALDMLKRHSEPLASVALDLGFASQSHFTRIFSGMTGMTPAKYERHFRPTTG